MDQTMQKVGKICFLNFKTFWVSSHFSFSNLLISSCRSLCLCHNIFVFWCLCLLTEWLVANRQNRLEFLLLAASDWENFVNSTLRQRRLRTLTEMGRQWGIMIGVDVPIAGWLLSFVCVFRKWIIDWQKYSCNQNTNNMDGTWQTQVALYSSNYREYTVELIG